MRLPVDEVVLTFNAIDAKGLPINDLTVARFGGAKVATRRIVAFDELVNRAIRVGILLDTSESMQRTLRGEQSG